METPNSNEPVLSVFAADVRLVVKMWDGEMARLTGIPAEKAIGQPLIVLFPDIESRGLLKFLQRTIREGTVGILAPVFHHYLIPCPPRTASPRFDKMQQRVTIAPWRENDSILGVIVTIEDVTSFLDRERRLADRLASGDERERLRAAEEMAEDRALDSVEPLTGAIGDADWRVRQAAVRGLGRRAAPEAIATLLQMMRYGHRDLGLGLLNGILQVLAMSDVDTITPLLELLRDEEAELRIHAALVLGSCAGSNGSEQAIPALIEALKDPDRNVRYHAIEALGKLRAAAARDALLEITEGGDFFLAFPAIEALSQIGDPTVVSHMIPLLQDDILREPAAAALGKLGDETAALPLAAALNQCPGSAAVLANALAALYFRSEGSIRAGANIADRCRRAIDADGIQNLLDVIAEYRGHDLRSLALVLGWLEGPAVEKALLLLLGEPAAATEVVAALVHQGREMTDLLIRQLAASDEDIRRSAVVALGRIGDKRATPALIKQFSEDPGLKVTCADALGKIGDSQAFEPLLASIADPDTSVRRAVVGALSSIGSPDMSARIQPLLNDPDPLARESAVRIAGYFGYPECANLLLERCGDSDERVRKAAVEFLPYLEDARVLRVLEAALQNDTPPVRAAAVGALSHLNATQAIPVLLKALNDPDAWVRYFAARSLGRQATPETLDALARRAREDAANHVRIAAIEALGQIGGHRAAQIIGDFTRVDNTDVARAAVASYREALNARKGGS